MRAVLTPPASVDEESDTVIVRRSLNEEKIEHQTEHEIVHEQLPEESPDVEMDQEDLIQPEEDFERSMTVTEEVAPEPSPEHAPEECLAAATYAVDEAEREEEVEPEQEIAEAPQHPPAEEEPEMEEGKEEEEGEQEFATHQTQKVPLLPPSPVPRAHSPPQTTTPYRAIRTYTTTIPMKFTPSKPSFEERAGGSHSEDEREEEQDAELIPHPADPLSPRERTTSAPTFDRAAALAAIAYRRGRAKSIADGQQATPRKQMLEGVSRLDRRDVSAPALGQKTIGGSAYRAGAASVGRGTVRGRMG
jgi:hypothetical protein